MFLTTHRLLNPPPIFMADMAAVAAHLGGGLPPSRIRLRFAGGCPPASRCHCRMAAANTGLPAAKSAKPPSSRRQTP